jgi:predicted N-acetyltransferase YhbS
MGTSARSVIRVRPIETGDIDACGRAAFESHRCVAEVNNFPPEHPSVEFAIGLISAKVRDPRARGWVAERNDKVIGSVFLNDFSPAPVAVIGPLTVHPNYEGGTGRALMEAAIQEARLRGIESLRLVQSPAHLRSLSLYTKLGFELREPLVLVESRLGKQVEPPATVRIATQNDARACNALCEEVHGFVRSFEVDQAIQQQSARVLERDGQIRAYTTAIGLRGHSIAQSTDDLIALVSQTPYSPGPGFFVPLRNGTLVRWLLQRGLKLLWPANLMSLGAYTEPNGAFFPSIAF